MKNFFFRLSLSQQFMLLSFPIMLLGTLLIGRWVGLQVQESVVHRVGGVTALYVDSFVAPHVQALARSDDLTEADRVALADLLTHTPLGKKIATLKIWRRDGTILFSSEKEQIGKRFPVDDGLARALRGDISSEISDRDEAEQEEHGQLQARWIETYTPLHADRQGTIIAAAEFYQAPDEVDRESGRVQRRSWMIVAGAMAAMYLALFVVVRRGSHTIVRQQRDLHEKVLQLTSLIEQNASLHQRVKRAAERATALNENFLQRLSADLHDGPGQDLGFALMQLKTLNVGCVGASSEACPVTRLAPVKAALQSALDDLRAISSDLQLPDIRHLTLPELAARVVRDYESKTGAAVELQCSVPDVAGSTRVKITLCRVLQESLANAFRHANGKNCRVHVTGTQDDITIRVSDDGPGFQPGSASERRKGRLGLAGMRERVEVIGGTFDIQSAANKGTTVIATLPLTSPEEAHA